MQLAKLEMRLVALVEAIYCKGKSKPKSIKDFLIRFLTKADREKEAQIEEDKKGARLALKLHSMGFGGELSPDVYRILGDEIE